MSWLYANYKNKLDFKKIPGKEDFSPNPEHTWKEGKEGDEFKIVTPPPNLADKEHKQHMQRFKQI